MVGDRDNVKMRFWTSHILRRIAIVLALLLTADRAWPQTFSPADKSIQRPATGSTTGEIVQPTPSALSGAYIPRHRSAVGVYCIRVWGSARPLGSSGNLFNHWVYAENVCSERIRLQVCYYSTTNCLDLSVAGHERKEAILGTLPSIKDFRYEYRERF